jgi:hypothetical protein
MTSRNGSSNGHPTLRALKAEGQRILRAMKKAVRQAALEHKREGLPMVVWEDGKVKEISADEFLRRGRTPSKKRKR